MEAKGWFKQLSIFDRPERHLVHGTPEGGAVTLLGVLLALVLFCHETSYFWRLSSMTTVGVDLERRHDLVVNLDIEFPALPCAAMSLSVLDVSGTSESDTTTLPKHIAMHKTRLDRKGVPVPGMLEYITPHSEEMVPVGAGGEAILNINIPQALKHLAEIEDEVSRGEGCRLAGTVLVQRVSGRLSVGMHKLLVFQLIPQLLNGRSMPKLRNMTHTVHHMSFGPTFPGAQNPLDNTRRVFMDNRSSKYFLKVVPTEYSHRSGAVTETHQYSLSEYTPFLEDNVAGVVDFTYDLSPIVVNINAKAPSILHYTVRICAVVGGVIALTRMLHHHVHILLGAVHRGSGHASSRSKSLDGGYMFAA